MHNKKDFECGLPESRLNLIVLSVLVPFFKPCLPACLLACSVSCPVGAYCGGYDPMQEVEYDKYLDPVPLAGFYNLNGETRWNHHDFDAQGVLIITDSS